MGNVGFQGRTSACLFWSLKCINNNAKTILAIFSQMCMWLYILQQIPQEVKFSAWEIFFPGCCSVTKSHMTLQPHELQHARHRIPSLCPWLCSNSSPLSQWYHPTVSSSVISFSSCPQSFRAWGSFQRVNSFHQVAKVLEFQL